MIAQATIIALIVLSIHYTMQEAEIFGKLGGWLSRVLPYQLHPPVFECNICMCPHYGSIIYVLIWGINWQWPIVVITAMGINIVINKWAPKEEIEVTGTPIDRIEELENKVEQIMPTIK